MKPLQYGQAYLRDDRRDDNSSEGTLRRSKNAETDVPAGSSLRSRGPKGWEKAPIRKIGASGCKVAMITGVRVDRGLKWKRGVKEETYLN